MTRKEFLRSVLGIGAGVGAIAFVTGCGDDGGTGVDAANVCTNPTNNISGNHGHVLTIPLADVDGGMNKTYDIMGTATHTHTLTITAAQFTQIKNGQTLNLTTSSGGAHTHMVAVMCVS